MLIRSWSIWQVKLQQRDTSTSRSWHKENVMCSLSLKISSHYYIVFFHIVSYFLLCPSGLLDCTGALFLSPIPTPAMLCLFSCFSGFCLRLTLDLLHGCVSVFSWLWSWPSSMAALCLCPPHRPCCPAISWACGSTAHGGGDMCVYSHIVTTDKMQVRSRLHIQIRLCVNPCYSK